VQRIIPEIKEYEYGNRQRSQRHGVAPFVDHVHLIPQLEKNIKRQNKNRPLFSSTKSADGVQAIDV